MALRKARVSTDKTKPVDKPAGKKPLDAIGRRKLFKLGVGVGVAALPYVIPTIYTFTVPKDAFACHMGVSHGGMTCS